MTLVLISFKELEAGSPKTIGTAISVLSQHRNAMLLSRCDRALHNVEALGHVVDGNVMPSSDIKTRVLHARLVQ